jgi:hypothetical protein
MAGRPSKLTSHIAARICHILRLGNYAETAAAHAGIDRATYFRWVKSATQLNDQEAICESEEYATWTENIEGWITHLRFLPNEKRPNEARPAAPPILRPKCWEPCLLAFWDTVEKSMAEAEVRDLMLIAAAAATQWQAAAWRLERMIPERFGRSRRRLRHADEGEGSIPPGLGDANVTIVFHLPANREETPPIWAESHWIGERGDAIELCAPVGTLAPAAAPASESNLL